MDLIGDLARPIALWAPAIITRRRPLYEPPRRPGAAGRRAPGAGRRAEDGSPGGPAPSLGGVGAAHLGREEDLERDGDPRAPRVGVVLCVCEHEPVHVEAGLV